MTNHEPPDFIKRGPPHPEAFRIGRTLADRRRCTCGHSIIRHSIGAPERFGCETCGCSDFCAAGVAR